MEELLPHLPEELRAKVASLSEDSKLRLVGEIKNRNGWIVESNPVLTSLLKCNTAVLFLGAAE